MGNRILKESICVSEDVHRMGWFGEVFYYRLLVNCDDFGRMDARPAILRARLFPLHAQMPLSDVEAALDLLESIGCVRRYTARERAYLQVIAWPNHQRVRVCRSKFPAPPWGDDGLPQAAADGGEWRRESEAETVSESKTESEAETEGLAAVAAAARGCGMPFGEVDARIAGELAASYSAAWAVAAVERAADGPSRTWRYVRGILSRWKKNGGIDARGGAKGGGAGKQVNAQMYTQRAYDPDVLLGMVEKV